MCQALHWALWMPSWANLVPALSSGGDTLKNTCPSLGRVYRWSGRRDSLNLLGLWDGFREEVGRRAFQERGKHVQRHREAWVGPIREPVVRDGAGKGGGDCQMERDLTNVRWGTVGLNLWHWGWWLGREWYFF